MNGDDEPGIGQKILRYIGYVTRPIFIISIGLVAVFFFMPDSIGDIPFSQLTLNKILYFVLWIVAMIVLILWIFSSPESSENWEAWGQFGLAIVCAAFVAAIYFSK